MRVPRHPLMMLSVLTFLVFGGCASGGVTGHSDGSVTPDSRAEDATVPPSDGETPDSGQPDGGGCDEGYTGPNCDECDQGYRPCGSLCVANGQGGSCISDYTRDLPTYYTPPVEDMFAAGYCDQCCDIGIDLEACRQRIAAGTCFASGAGHYSWRVVFTRSR